MDWVCSFDWVIPVFLLVPGRWANNGQTPQTTPPHCILRIPCAPEGYKTPTTYWEEGKFQELCGRKQDWACNWVPGQPCWLVSSCNRGMGIALQRDSLALANLSFFSNCTLFLAVLQVAPAPCVVTCPLGDSGKAAGRSNNKREEWDMPFQGHPMQLHCTWSNVQMLLSLSKMTFSLVSQS